LRLIPPVDEAARTSVLERFRRGDRLAFAELYRQHEGLVAAVARRFFASVFEQEEAVQEIWLLAHRMSAGFNATAGTFEGWLAVLGANRCRQLLRDKGRRPALDTGAEIPDASTGDAQDLDGAAVAYTRQVAEVVARFIASLPPEEARVFHMAFVTELSNRQIATELGLTERRCKYLRKKILARAEEDAPLARALQDARES
jgi:RNA polymerase sigma-70 factor (ECF subfamily)